MRYFEADGITGTQTTVTDYFHDYTYDARMEELAGFDRMRPPNKHHHAVVMQQITQPHHNDVLMGRGGKCFV